MNEVNRFGICSEVWGEGNPEHRKEMQKYRLLIFDFAVSCIEKYEQRRHKR